MNATAIFRVENLRKSFGPNRVLDGVSIDLQPGTVTVLMGANGAGKSTLVKTVCGVYQPDSGSLTLDGAPFAPASTAEAIRAGVVTVHQNINDGVIADLDVATNLMLDRLTGWGKPVLFNPFRIRREAREVADKMGLTVDLRAEVADLPLADRQMVAIARAMAHKPKVLILDEPTSSLSSAEAERLFDLVERLKAGGVAILYISHRMSDIRRLADRIVSLRDGRIAGTFDGPALDYEGAVNAMLGEIISHDRIEVRDGGETVFSARNLTLKSGRKPFSFDLKAGEIVAVTGLVGVGKTDLAETLFGARRVVSGEMTLSGQPYRPRSAADAIAKGVFLVAKDRAASSIVPDFNIYENISLPFLKNLSLVGVSARSRERDRARAQIEALGIVCRTERDEMFTLSGGNQQKVTVARWLAEPARLLILDEPFQGVDIAARRDIARKLRASADERATLVFLTELDEAFEIADRILVMSEHTLCGEHINRNLDMERLLAEISGQTMTVN